MIPSIWAPGWFWILFPRIAALPRLSRMLILLRTLYLYCIDFMLKGPCLKFPKYKIWIENYPPSLWNFSNNSSDLLSRPSPYINARNKSTLATLHTF